MVSFSVQMGNWRARLIANTPDIEDPVRHFGEFASTYMEGSDDVDLRTVVVASPAILDEPLTPAWLADDERRKWKRFQSELKKTYLQYCQTQSLNSSGKPWNGDLFCFSWPESGFADLDQSNSLSRQEGEKPYIVLITAYPEDLSHLTIWGYLFFLATQWHVELGGLSLHSAAVARGDDGFLFLGRSKAGKSTVAELSAAIGMKALGDDLNFVIKDKANVYRLAASPSPKVSQVGYSLQKPLLRGVFTLVQDKSDYLIPITPMKMAPVLFDSFIQQTPYVNRVADNLVGTAFQTVCEMARRIPGYELHFRKSPDFWKLIDEQFPG